MARKIPEFIKRFFKLLRKQGIICKGDYTCCGGCGHREMYEKGITNYVFYHVQEGDRMRENGCAIVYLQHNLDEQASAIVQDALITRNVGQWNGTSASCIELKTLVGTYSM